MTKGSHTPAQIAVFKQAGANGGYANTAGMTHTDAQAAIKAVNSGKKGN